MPAVRRVAEGAEVGVVGRDDQQPTAGAQQAVELFHRPNDVRDVFDDVNGADGIESAIAQGIGKMVEIGEDIGPGIGIAIDADRAGVLVDPTTDVEHARAHQRPSTRNWNVECSSRLPWGATPLESVTEGRSVAISSAPKRLNATAKTSIRTYPSIVLRQSSMVRRAKSAWSRLMTSGGQSRTTFGPAPSIRRPRSKAIDTRRSRSSGARSFVA